MTSNNLGYDAAASQREPKSNYSNMFCPEKLCLMINFVSSIGFLRAEISIQGAKI